MNSNTVKLLQKHFDTALETPDGVKKLRELILTLAMQGKLVPQNPKDQPASALLKEIEAEKKRLVKAGKIKKQEPLPPIKPEEVPYKLPTGWDWVRLGVLTEIITSGSRDWAKYYCSNGRAKFVRMGNLSHGWFNLKTDNIQMVNPPPNGEGTRTSLIENDLLVSITGDVGWKALIPKNFGEAYINQHTALIRFLEEFRGRFYPLILCSPLAQKQFNAPQRGIKNSFRLSDVSLLYVPLPPLAEQRCIVAKIDELMALCDRLEAERNERNQKRLTVHTTAMNRLLTSQDKESFSASWSFITKHFSELYSVSQNVAELKKAILQLAVMGKLVPQDPKDQPASALLKEIEAEKKRLVKAGKIKEQKPLPPIKPEEAPYELPTAWAWVRLGELVSRSEAGWSPSCESRRAAPNEPGVLKISAVSWGFFDESQNKALPKNLKPVTEHEVQVGDFLLSRANTAELVAKSVIVKQTRPKLYICDKIIRLKISSLLDCDFACMVNNSASSRSYYISKASGTSSSMQNVSRQTVLELPFPLPPLAEQRRIVAKIDRLMAFCDDLEKQIAAATGKQTAIFNAVLAKV